MSLIKTFLVDTDTEVSFEIQEPLSASMTPSSGIFSFDAVNRVDYSVDETVNSGIDVDFDFSKPIRTSMTPSRGSFSFTAEIGSRTSASNYTADEDKPDTIDGHPNPNKNILVDNQVRTIQANVLTAAQIADLLS